MATVKTTVVSVMVAVSTSAGDRHDAGRVEKHEPFSAFRRKEQGFRYWATCINSDAANGYQKATTLWGVVTGYPCKQRYEELKRVVFAVAAGAAYNSQNIHAAPGEAHPVHLAQSLTLHSLHLRPSPLPDLILSSWHHCERWDRQLFPHPCPQFFRGPCSWRHCTTTHGGFRPRSSPRLISEDGGGRGDVYMCFRFKLAVKKCCTRDTEERSRANKEAKDGRDEFL